MIFTHKDSSGVALRGVGAYFLCLVGFYFFDKATAAGTETRQLGIVPYIVISVWFAWIFIHNRILLRKLAFTKKIAAYVVLLLTGIVIASFAQQQIVKAKVGVAGSLLSIVPSVAFYTFLGSLIFLAFEYIRHRKDFYQLTTLKKESELQQLKSQLNPHFLFNALNNIYSYNLENNKFGNDLILKLSQLMRFIVETTQRETVPLSDEISFIESYIAFEKERLGERCRIDYTNNVDPKGRSLPPLLLFPFIENAFKHGTNSIQPTSVYISLEDVSQGITLTVTNQVTAPVATSTKTGLINIQRRLELLFPGRHQLEIRSDAHDYSVKLTIDL